MKITRIASILVSSSVLWASAAGAQEAFPNKPLHLVVGFPAGGASDVAARAVAEKLAESLGVSVVVENKPGAASNIAASYVAKANPDGYTVLFGTISLAINPSLYKNLNYNALTELAPVSQLSSAPFVLVANPSTPYRTVQDLLQAAKASGSTNPIHYASAGNGSGSHLFTELLTSRAGISLSHVPYRGAAPAMVDVLGGQVPVTFDNIITTLPLIETGKLRALAVSSSKRSPAAPDVPTLDESGVPGYDASSWFGLFAPAGTPAAIIERLGQAAQHAVKTDKVSETLRGVGAEPVVSTPAEFGRFYKAEVDKWAEVVKRANVQID